MTGTTIAHYEVLEKLGEGGMGVVYKARDTKLDRFVALKFLPPQSTASAPDSVRFLQEARAAASLNHPNVCSVIDIQENGGQTFIVMEFVNGQTLRELMGGRPAGSTGSLHATGVSEARATAIPVKRAIDIGIQIADGLAAAHEKGIVHRDIKPENIMVRKDGIVQIMDFGLAKLRGISRLTKEGSTVGTAGYMSPEQVQGQEADHRSDIFSLGVVLYELFIGELPFKGVHETAVNYEIVNVDPPPMSEVNADVDPALDAIVLECLAKEASDRYQSVAELAKDLRRTKRESSRQRVSRVSGVRPAVPAESAVRPAPYQEPAAAAPETKRGKSIPQMVWPSLAILFLIAAGVLGYLYRTAVSKVEPTVEFTIPLPARGSFEPSPPAISPDGRTIAYSVRDSTGKTLLWVRPLASSVARPLEGTEEASFPFWSPDSRYIGFFTIGTMKRVEAAGGSPQTVCDAADARGGTWSSDGVIVFAPGYNTGLLQVSASGGSAPSPATLLDTANLETTHRLPFFLPDGRHFLYYCRSSGEKSGVFLASLDNPHGKFLCDSRTNAQYAPPGYLLYVREKSLVAQRFDPDKGECSGEPVSVSEDVGYRQNWGAAAFAVSQNGVLVIASGGSGERELIWFDRGGAMLGRTGVGGQVFDFVLSPDEKRLVFRKIDPSTRNQDLWLLDLARSTQSRFTFDPDIDDDPVWSPDGSTIAFDTQPNGLANLHTKAATGAGRPELLLRSPAPNFTLDWSRDGRYIVYQQDDPKTKGDLWLLPLTGDKKPVVYLQTEFDETDARFSPDGQWLAYASDENGKYEVFIQHVPRTGGKWQVSISGGAAPSWRRDGKELYYLGPDKKLMAVDIRVNGTGIEAGIPSALFETTVDTYAAPNRYAASNDGRRFLVNNSGDAANTRPITVVLHWLSRVPQQ
jgi:serine/threonine protein kinase/Tol biopolymer transport system component